VKHLGRWYWSGLQTRSPSVFAGLITLGIVLLVAGIVGHHDAILGAGVGILITAALALPRGLLKRRGR